MSTALRLALGLALVLVLALAGCGGGSKTTFTHANYGTLMANPEKYNGSPVDVEGQVFLADNETPGQIWFAMYVDIPGLTWETLVELDGDAFFIQENDRVHVVGHVDQTLEKPESMQGFDVEPVVHADSVVVVG